MIRNIVAEMVASDLVACHQEARRQRRLSDWQLTVRQGVLAQDFASLLADVLDQLRAMLMDEMDVRERLSIKASLRLVRQRGGCAPSGRDN